MVQQVAATNSIRQGIELSPPQLEVDDAIVLRRSEAEHVEELYALFDQNRAHLHPWMPHANTDTLDAEIFHESTTRAFVHKGWYAPYEILHRGVLNGHVELRRSVESRKAKMGYWRAHDGRREGIMTRSAQRLVNFGFEQWGLDEILFDIAPDNQPSIAVAARLGAVLTDTSIGMLGADGKRFMISQWSLTR